MQVQDETVAVSEQALRDELAGRGLLVQTVRRKRDRIAWGLRARVHPEDFLLFNQEFIALLRAGLTIPDALALAANRPDCPALGSILQRVLEEVRSGLVLSEACARHPEAFDGMYRAALCTGEKSGDLGKALTRYQDYLRHKIAVRKKLARALAYPMFLLIALVAILAVLFTFVLPRFVAIYADFGAALPWPTQILLGFVDSLPFVVPGLALAGFAAWWGWRRLTATETGRLWIDHLKERIPYISHIQALAAAAQLARSLAALLAGGTPLVEAMRTVAESVSNRAYAARLAAAMREVTEGASLAQALRHARLLPDTALRMVEVGEATGGLDAMLAEVSQFYEDLLEHRLARLMSLIEPLLMLLMGIFVGGIIIVMYLPIFRIADVIR